MDKKKLYKGHRYSYTTLNEICFCTITIRHWIPLLQSDAYKMIVINSLKWLCDNEMTRIYGYVIMPNHIHLLWEQLKMNGKEFPKTSFEKFTAHQFQKKLRKENPSMLQKFNVDAADRVYNFWLRDPMAIKILGRAMAAQKLDYIHNNPLQAHWALGTTPESYRFSSAAFYEHQIDEFGILTNYIDTF